MICVLLLALPVSAGCAVSTVHAKGPARNTARTKGDSARDPEKVGATGGPARRTPSAPLSIPVRVVTGDGGTLVFVPVKVNGRGPFLFLLDTGSSTSSIGRSLVRRLGLPRTGRVAHVRGVTGEATVPVVKVSRWSVGGAALHARSLTVVDVIGSSIDGLLGSDELRRFGSVTVDFKRGRLMVRKV